MIFSTRSVSDSCILLIFVVFVSIRLIFCNFRFSVSSSFIVISACSSLSTSFLNLNRALELRRGWDALFFIAIFLN